MVSIFIEFLKEKGVFSLYIEGIQSEEFMYGRRYGKHITTINTIYKKYGTYGLIVRAFNWRFAQDKVVWVEIHRDWVDFIRKEKGMSVFTGV